LMTKADWAIAILPVGILSPTNSMRPLDSSSDGMLWGEGCAAIVLQRDAAPEQTYSTLTGW
jgi:acyl transferase domain-containing protein